MTFDANPETKKLTVERVFSAPLEKVWAAWTTPEVFEKWWGPRGWETTVPHMDFSNGGYLLYGMKCVDPEQQDWFGKESWGKATFDNIIDHESFTYLDQFTDSEGNPTPDMPQIPVTIRFMDEDGKTRVISESIFNSSEDLKQVMDMGMEQGLRQTWDRLEEILA